MKMFLLTHKMNVTSQWRNAQNIKFERNLLLFICQLTFLVETIAVIVLHRTQLYQLYILASMASGNFFPKNCEVTYNYLWVSLFSFFNEFQVKFSIWHYFRDKSLFFWSEVRGDKQKEVMSNFCDTSTNRKI